MISLADVANLDHMSQTRNCSSIAHDLQGAFEWGGPMLPNPLRVWDFFPAFGREGTFARKNMKGFGQQFKHFNIGTGTTSPNSELEVTGGIGVNRAVDVAVGSVDISGSYLTNGADYAEYFEAEEEVSPGDLVGINLATGKARRYASGDSFIGIAGDKPGIIGNNKDNKEGYALVGLLGQMDFKQDQAVIQGRLVQTVDGKKIGVLLSNGKVLIGT